MPEFCVQIEMVAPKKKEEETEEKEEEDTVDKKDVEEPMDVLEIHV